MEERELVRAYKGGDRRAGEALLKKHYGLIWNLARSACLAHRATTYMDDIVQEAMLGFLIGVEKYDETREAKVTTWASYWARAYAHRTARRCRSIVRPLISPKEQRLRKEINAAVQRLGASGIVPTQEVLAAEVDATPAEVAAAQRLYSTDTSLDAPLPGCENFTHTDLLTSRSDPEAELAARESNHRVRRAYNAFSCTLAPRDRRIWNSRWADDEQPSLADLGRLHGLSRERVRQIEEGLLDRFRTFLHTQGVEP